MPGRTGTFKESPETGRLIVPFGLETPGGVPYGNLSRPLVRDYAGDDANNREIDLGDDYDIIHVVSLEDEAAATDHLCVACAAGDSYRVMFWLVATGLECANNDKSQTNTRWQGKLSGADANKIMLGTNGWRDEGTNRAGKSYRIYAMKFLEIYP